MEQKDNKLSLVEIRRRRTERLKWLIPDKGLRDLIFEFDEDTSDFLTDKKRYLDYLKNILYLSVLLVYKKFTQFKTQLNGYDDAGKKSAIASFPNAFVRLYNLLDDCYTSSRLEFQLVEDVILNLQIDASISSDNGFIKSLGLRKFFNFSSFDNNLSKYLFSLKKGLFSSKQRTDFTMEDLETCIKTFPFLSEGKVTFAPFYGADYIMSVKLASFGEEISLDELAVVADDKFFVLNNLVVNDARTASDSNPVKEQSITAEYSVPLGRENFHVNFYDRADKPLDSQDNRLFGVQGNTLIEDILLKYRMVDIQRENNDGILWQYSFIDNKYIKYLALTIADCLNSEGKKRVYEKFHALYPDVFLKFDKDGIMHWDEIIIFLLLEIGVYKLLFFLLNKTDLRYDEVKAAFRLRFGENVSKLEEQYELIRDPIGITALKNNESKTYACVQALILLASKLLTANEVDIAFNNDMGALTEIRENVRSAFESNALSDDEKILFCANQIINLNNFIFIFYKGLLDFYAISKSQDIDDDPISATNENRGKKNERLRYETFRKSTLQARRNVYDKYSRLIQIKSLNAPSLKDLADMVDMSFEDINGLNDEISAINTEANIRFYDMTGRNKLFNQSDFVAVRSGVYNALQALLENRDKTRPLYEAVERYIAYLLDGTLDCETNIEGAIYPVMGVCSSSVISRDGYRYAYLSVSAGKDKARNDIKILSNITMKTGEMYYCVPNVKRCFYSKSSKNEHRIWMNPQLIPYLAYMPNMKASFEKLQFSKDYADVASLIFQSDKELYGKLFGNQQDAIKVISELFDMRGSLYYKDNIRFLRLPQDSDKPGPIVAAATFYSQLPEWDNYIMESAFRCAGVDIPPTYQSASDSVKDTFTDTIGDNYYVNDLCVHPDYRGKGYAKFILNSLIKIAERQSIGKNIVLSVYEDNAAALGLYNLMGFISYVSSYDNHGSDNPHKEKYYKMIKYI